MIGLCALPAAAQAPDALDRALDLEIARSKTLRAPNYPSVYYLSLAATDVSVFEQHCSLGSVVSMEESRQRILVPDIRVGDYAMDNHPVSSNSGIVGRAVSLEDDELSLRHSLWRVIDNDYKKAAADFLRKEALRVSRGKTEYDSDDLAREPARVHAERPAPGGWNKELGRALCADSSAGFRAYPGLLLAESSVSYQRQWSRFRDSDKSRVEFGRDIAQITLDAVAIASDGMKISASRHFVAASPEALPDLKSLGLHAREMLEDISALKTAQSTSPFSAPALIDPSVASSLVLAMGLRLTGEEQRNPAGAQIFKDKLGKPVLPETISLADDPALESYRGASLAGHYRFDDQAVAASSVTLVERGILKGFLLSRYPVVGFSRSNGHARAPLGLPPAAVPGVLSLRAETTSSEGELLKILRAECLKRGKTHGLWVRKLKRFSQRQGGAGQDSIRIIPGLLYLVEAETGKLTLVRDLDVVGTPLVMLSHILGAGTDSQAVNHMAGVPVSVITPSLLLAEAELQRSETKPENLPLLPPPAARKE